MGIKEFLDKLNEKFHNKFKFFKAEYPKGYDDDPFIIVVDLKRGIILAYFKYYNDMVFGIHADCSFDDLVKITDEIRNILGD